MWRPWPSSAALSTICVRSKASPRRKPRSCSPPRRLEERRGLPLREPDVEDQIDLVADHAPHGGDAEVGAADAPGPGEEGPPRRLAAGRSLAPERHLQDDR